MAGTVIPETSYMESGTCRPPPGFKCQQLKSEQMQSNGQASRRLLTAGYIFLRRSPLHRNILAPHVRSLVVQQVGNINPAWHS